MNYGDKISGDELADILYAAFSVNEVDLAYIAKPGQKSAPLQDHDVVRKIFEDKQNALNLYRRVRGVK
jgi:hypothetical protein